MPFWAKLEKMIISTSAALLLWLVPSVGRVVRVRACFPRGWLGETAVFVDYGERRYELAIGNPVSSIFAKSGLIVYTIPIRDDVDHHGEFGHTTRRHTKLDRVWENIVPILSFAIDSVVGVPGRLAVNLGRRLSGAVVFGVGFKIVSVHEVHVVRPTVTSVEGTDWIAKWSVRIIVRHPHLVSVLVGHLVDVREE